MKSKKLINAILALVLTGLFFTACKDDDTVVIPAVSFENITYAVSETSTSALVVTVTLDEPAPQALTVNFAVSGTAVSGSNFTDFTTTTCQIAEGATEGNIFLNVINVPLIEDSKTVILTLLPGTGYVVDDQATVTTITIQDNNVAPNDAPVVQFTSNDVTTNAYLEETITVTLGLDVAFDAATLIPIEITGDAVADTDYEITGLTANNEIEFAAGELAAEFDVVVKYNNVADIDVDIDFALAVPQTTAYALAANNTSVNVNVIDPTADMSAWFNEANKYSYNFAGGTSLTYRTWEEMPAYDVKRYYWDPIDNGGEYNLLSMDHHFYYDDAKHNTWKEVINFYKKEVGWPSVDIVEQERWEVVSGDFLGMTKYFGNEAKYGRTLMESVESWFRFVVNDPATPGEGIVVLPAQTIKLYKEADPTKWDDKIYNVDNTEYWYGWYADANLYQGDMSQSSIVTPVDIQIERAEGTFSNSSKEIIIDITFTCNDADFSIDPKYYTAKDGDKYTMKIRYINAK